MRGWWPPTATEGTTATGWGRLIARSTFACWSASRGRTVPDPDVELTFDFDQDTAGWTADFVDFPEGQDCDVGTAANVYVKAGASEIEPARVVDEDGMVRLYVDEGNQKNSGENAVLLGDIRNGRPGCGDDVPFARETVDSAERITVTADEEGGLWLLLGSESAFETAHELHFTAMRVSLKRVSG